MDRDFEAHLTDFGIAKSLCVSKTHTSTYVMGTIGYIDPEYARTSRLNEKSDVYSFGIVLLELLTGRKAVDNESNLHHLVSKNTPVPFALMILLLTWLVLVFVCQILQKAASNAVMETVDPDISSTCKDLGDVKKVFQLALLCTKRQPSDRPTMHEVSRVLGCLAQPNPPPKQQQQPDTNHPPPSYINEYANLKNPNALMCMTSLSTSDAQLFLKFGEVISQNSE